MALNIEPWHFPLAAGCPPRLNRAKIIAPSEQIQDPAGEFSHQESASLTQNFDALLSNPELKQPLAERDRTFVLTHHQACAALLAYRHHLMLELKARRPNGPSALEPDPS